MGILVVEDERGFVDFIKQGLKRDSFMGSGFNHIFIQSGVWKSFATFLKDFVVQLGVYELETIISY